LIINAAIAIVGPFFPPEAEKKGVDINVIGYIFSIYPFSFVIVSLTIPKILQHYSRKRVFIVGSVVYALSVIGFGMIVLLDDQMFLIMALMCRSIQGGSNAAVYTTAYSVFSMEYEGADIMKINSYFKSTLGVGLVIGLLFGTLLFMFGGYITPFVVFGIFFLIYIPLVKDYFPDSIGDESKERDTMEALNQLNPKPAHIKSQDNDIEMRKLSLDIVERKHSCENFKYIKNRNKSPFRSKSLETKGDTEKKSPYSGEASIPKINYSDYIEYESDSSSITESLLTKTIVKCLLLSVIFMSLLNFAPAILSKRLSELNIHKYFYGVVFAIPCIVPICSILIAIHLMNKSNGNVVLTTGTVIMSIGFFVVANEDVTYFLIGVGLLGFSAPFAVLPLFPMMTNSIDKENENAENVTNILSGLYNAALGIGAIIGPLIGANLYYYFGFNTTAYCLGNT
jgi:MFS family permease